MIVWLHCPPDLIPVSSDAVQFFVNSGLLRRSSHNEFADTTARDVAAPRVRAVRTPFLARPRQRRRAQCPLACCSQHTRRRCIRPDLPTLAHLPTNGMSPQASVIPGSSLFEAFGTHPALAPLETYRITGAHDLSSRSRKSRPRTYSPTRCT
ncbi:hypothetical protein BD626DRAFT_489954, partial [Schizophyllum amplum]